MKVKIIKLPRDYENQEKVIGYLTNKYSLRDTFNVERESYVNNIEFREHKDFSKDPSMRELVEIGERDVTWSMFLLLITGIREAAFYLASSLLHGFGTFKDEFLTSLTISIGIKLHDPKTIELMEGKTPIADNIQLCAQQCVDRINYNSRTISDSDLTYQELIGYSKDFDNLVKSSGHSYYSSIESGTMKPLAKHVEMDYGIDDSAMKVSGEGVSTDCCSGCVIL